MAAYSDKEYYPGALNNPGKGQSPANPLGSAFFQSIGVVDDLSVYSNIFSGGTINSDVGFTVGLDNFFGKEGFQVDPPGLFNNDVAFTENVTIEKNITVGILTTTSRLVVNGREYKATRVVARNGTFTVLAA